MMNTNCKAEISAMLGNVVVVREGEPVLFVDTPMPKWRRGIKWRQTWRISPDCMPKGIGKRYPQYT